MSPTSSAVPEHLRGRRGSAKIAVITVIREELDVAREVFETLHNVPGSPYYVPAIRGDHQYDLILRKCADRSNVPSFEATSDFIEDYRPSILMLLGIAGGIEGRDNVALGDVVVADFVNYSEFAKLAENEVRFRNKPHDHPSLNVRESFAEPLEYDDWQKFNPVERPDAGKAKTVVGNIVAGEKIYGDSENEFQKVVLEYFDKAVAVDMESMGFARAVFHARKSVHYNPQCAIIRGISDLVDDKQNPQTRDKWKRYAAGSAAAFARGLVEKLLPFTVFAMDVAR